MNNKTIYKWFTMLLLMMVAGISSAAAQSLALDAFSIKAGETKDVAIKLAAEDAIYGIQTDIALSEGLTLEAVQAAVENYSFAENTIGDVKRVSLLSLEGAAIPAGDVITMTVKAADTFAAGTISLTNTRLTTNTTGTELKVDDVTVNVTLDASLAEAKAALQTAIAVATAVNQKLGDANLAAAIEAATAALGDQAATVESLAAAAQSLNTAATTAAKSALTYAVTLAKALGVDTSAAEAVLANGTAQQMLLALQSLFEQAEGPATEAVISLSNLLSQFNQTALVAIMPEMLAVKAAFENENGTFAELKAAIDALVEKAKPYAPDIISKIAGYAEEMNNETLNRDVAALQAAGDDIFALAVAAKQFMDDFITVAGEYLAEVKQIPTEGKQGVDNLNAAIEALESALAATSPNLTTIATAVKNLVNAVKAFNEANNVVVYTIAGTKNLTGTEEDWAVVEANNMTLNDETGLYEWKAENITVNAENHPAFKVVKNGTIWYPEGDASSNWVITPESLDGEGVYTITITFNPANNEIGVTGVKAETDDAIYTIYYSDYTVFPFFVMGFTPEFVDGVMVDGGSSDWHQYFIADGIPTKEKGIYTVKAMVKASEAININVNMGWGWGDGQQMGTSVAIGTEWQEVTWKYEGVGGTSCNLVAQPGVQAATIEWKYLKVYFDGIAVEPEWTDIIVNGDMEGDDPSCFYVTEQGIGGPFLAPFTEGIGKDGSKAVKVDSYDDPANDWASQFFIRLPYQIPAGTKYKVSFDYKADKAGDFDTQSHAEPGQYIHYAAIGSGSFTTDWQTYEKEGTIPTECDGSDSGNGYLKIFQTVAFNLAKNKVATRFIFDNVKFEIPSDVVKNLTLNPAQNPQPYTKPVFNSMTIVGDFLGLATEENPDANWDLANGWQMTQDAENEAVWTLVVDEFKAEAKNYEYKAAANGSWDGYKLPNEGNANKDFSDPNLGAGNYKLTFTVDTRKHSLNLDVEKLDVTTYTATFTTDAEWEKVYAYAWSGTEGQEGFKKFLGDWPGTELEAVDGVYTVNIVSTDAPEWIVFNNGNGGEGNQTSDLEFVNGGAYEYKKPSGEEDPIKVAPQGWVSLVTNGNLADDDVSNYVMKEYPDNAIVGAAIEMGAGTKGSRGIIVRAGDDTNNTSADGAVAWDSQFWIVLPEALPAGTKLHVEFDYKASQVAKASTQSHGNPGAYQHWAAIGDVNFTTEWQSFSTDIEVDDAMAKGDNGNGNGTGLKSIAFNLQEEKTATDYHFDNFGVWYEKPVEITSMAIVGDFLGLATEENPNADWDPANGWQMEQDAENPAIWTLTKPFTAEAKTYYYKATANGKYGDYELPEKGNQEFTFGTADYPAGDYKLVFTADTENNALDLVVKPATVLTFTATFTTNAYWWDKVYAYAWTEDGENVTEYLGAWPGIELKANSDGVYTVTVEGEVAPAMICFSNGNTGEGNQTEDLTFEDGKAYEFVFAPTFDFENNNGQWADGTTVTEENPLVMDDVTLAGVTNTSYKGNNLKLGNKGSFKLIAPEGKSIVKVEIKALSTNNTLTASEGEVANVKVVTQASQDPEDPAATILYSISQWTGKASQVTFSHTKRSYNIGFINVTLADGATTGINGIASERYANEAVYNLSGQRVMKAQKGLYIVNGKKIVIK